MMWVGSSYHFSESVEEVNIQNLGLAYPRVELFEKFPENFFVKDRDKVYDLSHSLGILAFAFECPDHFCSEVLESILLIFVLLESFKPILYYRFLDVDG
jgi:hypothetical protein